MHKIRFRRARGHGAPRKRMSYASVAATLALVLALGGGTAWAAHHYLITSTSQIKPNVLKSLRGYRGYRGYTGKNGTNGTNGTNGATGATGAPGATGKTGPSHIITWQVNNVAVGSGGASGTGVVTLATVGPFTILGKCTTSGGFYYAQTYLRTSQAGSAENDYWDKSYGVFGPTTVDTATLQPGGAAVAGDVEVGNQADNSAAGTDNRIFYGPYDGSTTALSADGLTYLNAYESVGVLVAGATAAAPCYFGGYAMSNTVS